MDQTWKSMLETNVSEYIGTVDFKNPDFSVNEFKNELAKIVGMKPAVKLKWNTTEKVNELLKKSGAVNHTEIIDKVEEVQITFVDTENKPVNFKFLI